MVHVGLIWLCASGLCWVVSPDTVGKVGTFVFATLGLLFMLGGFLL